MGKGLLVRITGDVKNTYPNLCKFAEQRAYKKGQNPVSIGLSKKDNLKITSGGQLIIVSQDELNECEKIELSSLCQKIKNRELINKGIAESMGENMIRKAVFSDLKNKYAWIPALEKMTVGFLSKEVVIRMQDITVRVPYSSLSTVRTDADVQQNIRVILENCYRKINAWKQRQEREIAKNREKHAYEEKKKFCDKINQKIASRVLMLHYPYGKAKHVRPSEGYVDVKIGNYTGFLNIPPVNVADNVILTLDDTSFSLEVKGGEEDFIKQNVEMFKNAIENNPLRIKYITGTPSRLEALAKEYKKQHAKWLSGVSTVMTEKCSGEMFIREGVIRVKNGAGTDVITNGEHAITYSPAYKKFMELSADPHYSSCRKAAIKAFAPYKISVVGKENKGILNGETTLKISDGKHEMTYVYETEPWNAASPRWEDILEQNIQEIHAYFQNEEERETEEKRKKYKEYYESFLMQDVMEFVEENEDYITENAVVQALRGLTVRLGANIYYTDACGLYKLFVPNDISFAVSRMIKKGYLQEKIANGKYGTFYLLKKYNEAIPQETSTYDKGMIVKKWKSKKPLCDPEALTVMQMILKKEEKEPADYLDLLDLLSYPAAALRCIDEYRTCFSNAPKEVKDFVRIRKEDTDGTRKQLLTELLRKKRKEG